MQIFLIRHGITEWNQQKRIQGRIDQPLSDEGRTAFANRQLPAECGSIQWFVSPLQRARQTAGLLDIKNPVIEDNLIEMHWGDWEGQVLKPLRRQLGEPMRANERRGLDFQPPNGESPRQVQHRILSWLSKFEGQDKDIGAVVHKGIIRCFYSKAFNWDMTGESPVDFDWGKIHVFQLTNGVLEKSHGMIDFIPKD